MTVCLFFAINIGCHLIDDSLEKEFIMKWVHLYQRDFGSGQASIVATCVLSEDGQVQISGSDKDLMARLQRGVLIPAEDRVVVPRDAEDFLGALKNEFRGLGLVATDIQVGDQVEYPESAA